MACYYTCPLCGSNLDHGEICDCKRLAQKERENGNSYTERESMYAALAARAVGNFKDAEKSVGNARGGRKLL